MQKTLKVLAMTMVLSLCMGTMALAARTASVSAGTYGVLSGETVSDAAEEYLTCYTEITNSVSRLISYIEIQNNSTGAFVDWDSQTLTNATVNSVTWYKEDSPAAGSSAVLCGYSRHEARGSQSYVCYTADVLR